MTGTYWDDSAVVFAGDHHVSEGCDHCWAEDTHNRRFLRLGWAPFNQPFFRPAGLRKIEKGKKPRTWAIWNDPFCSVFTNDQRLRLLDLMRIKSDHTFLILTKRPEEMRAFAWDNFPLPPNVWWGVTVEMAKYLLRIEILQEIPSPNLYVSFEPLLDDVSADIDPIKGLSLTSQVIIGKETGRSPRPCEREWVDDLAFKARISGAKVWIKHLAAGSLAWRCNVLGH